MAQSRAWPSVIVGTDKVSAGSGWARRKRRVERWVAPWVRLENRACEPARSPKITSAHVMISRGKSRFVDEVHILRSSAELLTELQKAEGGESCLGQSKSSIQETGAARVSGHTSIQETCADQASFFSHKEPFLRPRGCRKLFLPMPRMEELCQQRSPKWLQEW